MIKIIKKVLNVFAIIIFMVSVILNILAVIAGFGICGYLEDLYYGKREKLHILDDFNIIKEPTMKVVK